MRADNKGEGGIMALMDWPYIVPKAHAQTGVYCNHRLLGASFFMVTALSPRYFGIECGGRIADYCAQTG